MKEQNHVRRFCAVCGEELLKGQPMLDLFSRERPNIHGMKVEWVHEECVRKAMEIFIVKRRSKTSG